MKFKVSPSQFAEAIADVQLPAAKVGVAGTSLVLLEAENGLVRVTASDLDVTVSRFLGAQVDRPGTCAVNSRKLLGISKSLPSEVVEVRTNPEKTKLGLFAGSAKATLPTMPVSEFPVQAKHNGSGEFLVEKAELRRGLERVHYAAAKDGTRYVCMGVCVEAAPGRVKFAATDTKRVAVSECSVEGQASFKMLVPSRSVERLLKMLAGGGGRVKVSYGGGDVVFSWDEGRLESKLIEGEFPNYGVLLEQMGDRTATVVSREGLLGAVRRAEVAGAGERVVSLYFRAATLADKPFLGDSGGAIVVSLPETSDGSYSEVIPLEFAPEKESRVSFLGDYLTDPLGASVKKELVFRHGGEGDIAFIEIGDEILSIVAPVRTS